MEQEGGKMTKCKAVTSGKVKRKGRASIEGYKNGKPIYYCYGYRDRMTDEPIEECYFCNNFVGHADDSFWNRMVKND